MYVWSFIVFYLTAAHQEELCIYVSMWVQYKKKSEHELELFKNTTQKESISEKSPVLYLLCIKNTYRLHLYTQLMLIISPLQQGLLILFSNVLQSLTIFAQYWRYIDKIWN